MTARWSDGQARRGECAPSPADPKRWQGRWAAGVTGRRTSSLARREPAVWATRLPRIAAAVCALLKIRGLITQRDEDPSHIKEPADQAPARSSGLGLQARPEHPGLR